MTLKKSSTIICLTIQLLLNIVCMILVYSYVIKTKIPVELDVEFPIDLYFSFAGYLLLLLLIVFNIITIICIVSEIINLKNKYKRNNYYSSCIYFLFSTCCCHSGSHTKDKKCFRCQFIV